MKADLTGKDLRDVPKPAEGYLIYYDCEVRGSVPGLGLRVTAKNARSWILNYTAPNGGRRRATLGPLGGLNLQQARAKASAWRMITIQAHPGPLEHKAAKQAAAREEEAKAREAQAKADAAPSFARLAEIWMARHGAVYKRAISLANDEKVLRLHLNPRFGKMKAAEITRTMIEEMMADMKAKDIAIQANRTHSLLRTILKYGVKSGFLTTDAAAGIKRFPENDHRIKVSRPQLDNLYRVIEAHPNRRAANAIKLLVWTGARSGEVLGAKWEEVDLEQGLWERPAHRNKQGEPTITPLAPLALDLLKAMQAASTGPYLFPSPRNHGRPLEGLKTYWLEVRKLAGLPTLRVHDLRHVHAQALLEAGVPFDTIAELLGHRSTAMTKKYAARSSKALRIAAGAAARALAPPRPGPPPPLSPSEK